MKIKDSSPFFILRYPKYVNLTKYFPPGNKSKFEQDPTRFDVKNNFYIDKNV